MLQCVILKSGVASSSAATIKGAAFNQVNMVWQKVKIQFLVTKVDDVNCVIKYYVICVCASQIFWTLLDGFLSPTAAQFFSLSLICVYTEAIYWDNKTPEWLFILLDVHK